MRNILELPTVRERDVKKIHEFYEILLFNVESLQTMESLNKQDAAVRFTFDKLREIKNELAMINDKWSEWSFVQFLEALEKWTVNNPISEAQRPKVMAISNNKKEKSRAFYTKRDDGNQTTACGCLFCENPNHRAVDCDKVVSLEQRKESFPGQKTVFQRHGI